MARITALLLATVALISTWDEARADGPPNKDENPDGFWFGRQSLICVRRTETATTFRKVKRSASRVFVHDISHTVLYYRDHFYEWGTNPRGYRAEVTPKASNCPITWRQRPSGSGHCSTYNVLRFARQYASLYGPYELVLNNCHHFVNRLAAMLESSACTAEDRNHDDATGVFAGIIDTVKSWWIRLSSSTDEGDQPDAEVRLIH